MQEMSHVPEKEKMQPFVKGLREWLWSIQNIGRRKVPVMLQMSAVECGAACLAMMLGYYGHKTSIADICSRYSVGRDGLSARNITQAARNYGLRVRAISMQKNDLRYVTLPAIVHWEFNHFIVVERWSPERVDVVDPAVGRKRLSEEEFNNGFTGVILMMEPGDQFSREKLKRDFSLRSYLKQYIRCAPVVLTQVLASSLVLQVFGLIVPVLTAVIVDQVIPLRLSSVMPIIGLGILILAFGETLVLLLRALLLVYLENRIDTHVLPNFFEHLLQLPLPFFQQRSSGDMLTRIASNTALRDVVSTQFISNILDGGLVIVYLVILFGLSPAFGVLVVVTGLIEVILLVCANGALGRLSRQELDVTGKAQGYVAEMLTSIETVKAAGFEQQAFQHWSNLFFEQLNVSNKKNTLIAFLTTFQSLLQILAPLLLLCIGAIEVLNGSLALGTMLALNSLAATFLTPLSSLVKSGMSFQVVKSHIDRIADVMDANVEQDADRVQIPPTLSGNIRLEHVSFRYNSQLPEVLSDISLTIRPGQRIAIVGQTGSGKSTLGKLLLGLYLPTEGEIYYDDLPLSSLNYQMVRNQIGVVTQESSIFSGTIKHNITFAHPELDMQGVVNASQLACFHDDVILMPMGYETFVAEGGNALSGGQRQRLALARALAYSPRILLLDEATSALDVVTENRVQENLASLSCTQIIIAHRLSTVRDADLILVLDRGRVVERGRHQELLAMGGYYSELVQRQLVEERESSMG